MKDLIERQAAIDIERNATVDTNPSHFEAHQKFTQFMDDAEISSFGRWQWSNGFNTALTAVGMDLKKLPSAQPDVPDINDGNMISRQAATTIPVMPKEHRHYQTNNLDDAYEHGWNDLQECIENLPPIQPKSGHWMIEPTEEPEYCKCSECGYVNLIVEVFSLDGYHYCPNCGAKMERNEDGTDL